MKHALALAFLIGLPAIPAPQAAPIAPFGMIDPVPMSLASAAVAPITVAASWSCNPRKTCSRIGSCDEAYWHYRNCSWGGRLDGDNDGVPCESICN
jgi:hypothetical protein